jgi:hypothetical protein
MVTGLDRGLDRGCGLELGTAKSKMNVSVPTGNQRLWLEEHMIAFVGPSSLILSLTDTVLVSKMGSILGIELGIKLGT